MAKLIFLDSCPNHLWKNSAYKGKRNMKLKEKGILHLPQQKGHTIRAMHLGISSLLVILLSSPQKIILKSVWGEITG